jgi:hypothetical protein
MAFIEWVDQPATPESRLAAAEAAEKNKGK